MNVENKETKQKDKKKKKKMGETLEVKGEGGSKKRDKKTGTDGIAVL